MSDSPDIAPYVKAPSLLVDLCREVIDGLDASTDDFDVGEREAQLREISKTIERLEKAGVSVPDVLRAEKTRLAAALGVNDDSIRRLIELSDGLSVVIRELRERIERRQPKILTLIPHPLRKSPERLTRQQLRDEIVASLRALGRKAPRKDVFREMEKNLADKFFPADLVVHTAKDGTRYYSWQQAARKERTRMVDDGILGIDTATGEWELI